ncbi:hypothetical protein [Levilactobacillus namurensis]|uniref:hypothetical protein n=1 Tax=Levilactobacillus namurensis TaxID=380393 RepID=UPI000462EA78|nr:hypothetical protein [Levilactobacillus namurensis]
MTKLKQLLLIIVATLSMAAIVNLTPVFETTASAKSVTIPKRFRHTWTYIWKSADHHKQVLKIHKRSANFYEDGGKIHYKFIKVRGKKNTYDLFNKKYQGLEIKYRSHHKLRVLYDVSYLTFKR